MEERKDSRLPYSVEVKETILNSLEKGTSVLQKDRSGIEYSQNAKSGAIYDGLNQLHLQQFRADNDKKSPYFLTLNQIDEKGMGVKEKTHGALISYFYKKQNYKFVHNLEDVDPRQKKWNPETKQQEITSSIFTLDKYAPQVAYPNAVKGEYLKPETENVLDKFSSDVSRYLNSIYTGADYKAASYSKEDVKNLRNEFEKPYSKFFIAIDKAYYVATNNNEKLNMLYSNVERKQKELAVAEKTPSRKKESNATKKPRSR